MAKICLAPKILGLLLVQGKIYVILLHTYSLHGLKCLKKYNLCLNISMHKYRRTGLFQRSYSHQIFFFKQDEHNCEQQKKGSLNKTKFCTHCSGMWLWGESVLSKSGRHVQRLSKSGLIISISTTESFDIGVTGGSVTTHFSGGDMVLQQTLITKLFKVKDSVRGTFLHVLTLYNITAFKASAAAWVIQSGTIYEADTTRVAKFTFRPLIPRKIKR